MHKILTPTERENLLKEHRLQKDGRTRDRMKAVLLYDNGWCCRAIAEALFLDDETVGKHIKEYKDKKKLSIKTGGKASKLDARQTEELAAHVEGKVYSKVSDVCAYVRRTYGVTYSVSGMTAWLKAQGFTYKKPKGVPAKADPARQEAFVREYEELRRKTPEDEPVLFCDGVHPTMQTKITCGWIRKGKNKEIATVASRTRMNIMGALNLETMKVITQEFETLDGEATARYFAHIRAAYPHRGKIHLILDQSGYHKSSEAREAALKHNINLIYLPPYSPNLNPIERLWKVMNEQVRNNRYFKSAQEFRAAVLEFFNRRWDEISSLMIDRINDNFQILNPTFST